MDVSKLRKLVSIDPSPRTPVYDLVDEQIPRPLEDIDLKRFEQLVAGDIRTMAAFRIVL